MNNKERGSGRCDADGAVTRGGHGNYTTTTGQKLADGACCFALFGAIPFLLMIVGVGL